MKYTDRIYGDVDITENVVVDIINSQAFQRLKGIDQAGYFEVYFPGTKHSRFEHSIGCYVLLKMYGASLEEQLAGLIHDVSHSAFSHTADYIFSGGRAATSSTRIPNRCGLRMCTPISSGGERCEGVSIRSAEGEEIAVLRAPLRD